MKAISLWEPWATAMRLGAKRIETRGWATTHRGPLLICAAKRCVKREIREVLHEWTTEISGSEMAFRSLADLHFGQAVCIVDLVDCQPTDQLRWVISEEEYWMGDYESGRYGWITANLRKIDPFSVKGKQGFFNVELPPEPNTHHCPKCGEVIPTLEDVADHAKCFESHPVSTGSRSK